MGVFQEIFVNFARETSIHGPNFLTHKSFFGQKRIIWALALLGIFTYCTYYQKSTIECKFDDITYCKVASSNTSLLDRNTCRLFQIAYEGDFCSLQKYRHTSIYTVNVGTHKKTWKAKTV